MAKKEIEAFYSKSLNKLTKEAESNITYSSLIAFLKVDARRYWASVLYTRIGTSAISILYLCPGSKLNEDGTHWDFSSIASIARNIFEVSLTFFYLAVEEISNEEWMARLKVMQNHDCLSRLKLFREFDPKDPKLKGFKIQSEELKSSLLKNKYFLSLPEKQRKSFLKGERSWLLTQDEILERMGEKDKNIRGFYRFLSSHVHSFPLAFYKMAENDLGRGVDSDVEVGYSATAIDFAGELLHRTTADMEKLFSDLVKNPHVSFDWDLLKRH